jgi:outer membrane protein TolC
MITLAGCAAYHEKPLSDKAVAARLAVPEMAALRIEASRLRHPVLKPLRMDPRRGLSPEEAAVLAVLVNPTLKAERDRKEIAAAELIQAGILPNPQLSASLDFPVGGATQGTVNGYGLGLDYDIQALIARGADMKGARLKGASVALDVAWKEWQVAEAAKRHAFRLYLLERKLAVARDEERGLRENRDAIKKAVDRGDMSLLDLSAAQASLQKAHLAVLGIGQALDQERLALLKAIGFEPGRPVRLRSHIRLPRVARIPGAADLSKGLTRRRLDLLALRIGYKSQEERLRAAVLSQFPRITTGFSQAQDTGDVVTRGLTLTIGLPFFDRNQGRIAIERATRKELFDAYASRLFEARSAIAALVTDLRSISRQISATEGYLPTQRELVATYHDAMLQGNADVLTYYTARDELISTQLSLLDLQLQLVDRFVALEIEAGEDLWQPQHTGMTQ